MKTWPHAPTKKWKNISHKLRKTIKIPTWTPRNSIKVWNSWKHAKIGSAAPWTNWLFWFLGIFWLQRNSKNDFFRFHGEQENEHRHFFNYSGVQKMTFLDFTQTRKMNIVIFWLQRNSKNDFFRFHGEHENEHCHFCTANGIQKTTFLDFTENKKMNIVIFSITVEFKKWLFWCHGEHENEHRYFFNYSGIEKNYFLHFKNPKSDLIEFFEFKKDTFGISKTFTKLFFWFTRNWKIPFRFAIQKNNLLQVIAM